MSAALLTYPQKSYEVADDIESFYHLLSLFALRFHRHKRSVSELGHILSSKYDGNKLVDGFWHGSTLKYDDMVDGHLSVKLGDSSPRFNALLVELATLCKKHYAVLHAEHGEPQEEPVSFVRGIDDADADEDEDDSDSDSLSPDAGVRTLDTHDGFLKVLSRALKKKDWIEDKLAFDQFTLIPWPRNPNAKRCSVSTASKTASASAKRNSTDVDGVEVQPGNKKVKGSWIGSASGHSLEEAPSRGTRSRSARSRTSVATTLPTHPEK